MIIGVIGPAGSGKDTVAEMIAPVHPVDIDCCFVNVRALVEKMLPATHARSHHPALRARAAQVAFADPLKEYCRKVYDFSTFQLWGPSDARNKPDKRYPRTREMHELSSPVDADHMYCCRCNWQFNNVQSPEPPAVCVDYLTPREALQQLGTQWGRKLYDNTWVDFGLRRARQLLEHHRTKRPKEAHTFMNSWVIEETELVVISDVRFVNEAKALREAGCAVWKVVRPDLKTDGAMYQHQSESEQRDREAEIDTFVTQTITNDNSLDALYGKVQNALKEAGL